MSLSNEKKAGPEMDYRVLLCKYVSLIASIEGITYVDFATLAGFTEKEIATLQEIDDMNIPIDGE